jgi:amidohydrolase
VDRDDAKARIRERVADLHPRLVDASHAIWARPELAYREHFASEVLAGLLAAEGLEVTRPAFGLDTSFVATVGDPAGPNVVICCEYDALPDIGHACGHNVIGTIGIGAGLAAASVAAGLGGRVTVLGCPAEEGGGGKLALLDAGAFDGATAAMMVHGEMGDVEYVPYLANDQLDVVMRGRPSHASSAPWAGINALDALVLGYAAMLAMRGTLREDEKVHGIITEGGTADNVVPERAVGTFRVRAGTAARLGPLRERLASCYRGAAEQVGCEADLTWRGAYLDVRSNRTLARVYRRNAEALGREFFEPEIVPASVAGSTDMGNVSYAVPVIHPVMTVCPLGVSGHTPEFAEWAVSDLADRAIADGAAALAMTAVDLWCDDGLRRRVREEFDAIDDEPELLV